MELRGKRALVTGSSRGLGRATALELAKRGADVLVHFHREADRAEEVVSEIRNIGRRSEAYQADIGNASDIFRMANEVLGRYGHLDILVNNAGTIVRPASWNEISKEDVDRTIDINLKGAIYCIQAFAPSMVERQSGRIINVTTTYAITGAAPVLVYTAAKAGIISMTKAMAQELGKHGVTVNAVAPGNFDTDLAVESGDAVNEWAISTTPLGRLGKPVEIGEAVVFLVESDFITGHTLVVDGGQLLNI
ncbi:SDR family NAD(P)-dependent oxidoreductase [Aggregatilinea lenta]|uniref:SDR family NAD(P)-dependent oxidoreductase n=1 Tax=Aggregatilinea lenta TaxID=913108 RepID=UPI000E5A7D2E|nr:3-oxoacyl-ACP reductase family protein [Aggregatilinea lenta]